MSYLPSLIVSRPPAANPHNFGLVEGNNLFIEDPAYTLKKLNKSTFVQEGTFTYSVNKGLRGDIVTDGTYIYALTTFSNGLGDTDARIIKVPITTFNSESAGWSDTWTASQYGPVGDHTIVYEGGYVYTFRIAVSPLRMYVYSRETTTLAENWTTIINPLGGATSVATNIFINGNDLWTFRMDNSWSSAKGFNKITGAELGGIDPFAGKRMPYAAQDGTIIYGTDKLNFGAATNGGNPYINIFDMSDSSNTWYNIDSRLANYHCRGIWVDGNSIYLKVYEVTDAFNGDGNIYLWRLNKNRLTDTVRDHVFLGAVTGFGANEGV